MIHVVIVEDEQLAAKELAKMLGKIRPGQIHVDAILENVNQAVEYFLHHVPDLIFMDIHLGDGNSFEIFDHLKLKAPIIFTTAYNQYALRAFKHLSVDYLLKPIDEEDLDHAFQKLERFWENRHNEHSRKLNHSTGMLLDQKKYKERFLVNCTSRIRLIKLREVAYFMADGKFLYLFTTNGHRYLLEESLHELEKQLNPKLFFRINRKFIVNYHAIQEMYYYSKSRIKLKLIPPCPQEVSAIVSREKSVKFKQWLSW